MPPGTEKTFDTFAQFGPWALLTAIVLAAAGIAAWRIYLRMANALDAMHAETVKIAAQHAEDIKMRDDRILQVVDNNTKGFTMVAERMTAVESRLSEVEEAVRD